jgi:hypothetical protein
MTFAKGVAVAFESVGAMALFGFAGAVALGVWIGSHINHPRR